MKKYLFVAMLSAAAALMTGCLGNKSEGSSVSPTTQKGLQIYNLGSVLDNLSLDPTNIAYRLNILLTEAKAQGVTELDDVRVTLNDSKIPLKERFFSGATITAAADKAGDYLIRYNGAGDKMDYDTYVRQGSVVISTGSKLLQELEFGEYWSISFPEDDRLIYRVDLGGIDRTSLALSAAGYTLAPAIGSLYSFLASFEDLQVGATDRLNEVSNWTGEYTINSIKPSQWTFASARATNYSLSGNSAGQTFMWISKIRPNITVRTSFTFRPACGIAYCNEATIRTAFSDGKGPDPENYPSPFSVVKFVPSSAESECARAFVTITYNGETQTL